MAFVVEEERLSLASGMAKGVEAIPRSTPPAQLNLQTKFAWTSRMAGFMVCGCCRLFVDCFNMREAAEGISITGKGMLQERPYTPTSKHSTLVTSSAFTENGPKTSSLCAMSLRDGLFEEVIAEDL